MNGEFKICSLTRDDSKELYPIDIYGYKSAEKVNNFHKSFPEYSITPLVSLDNFAKRVKVKSIYVKDESYRFNLNAFKVLGGSYAIGSYIAQKLNMNLEDLPYEKMVSKEIRDKLGDITFVTATDGNHGRGVAWTANRLKQKSVVYMPKGTATERLNNILSLGSNASITDMSYDDDVRLASENAEKYGWVLVQDTSHEGYEDIPTWIMQGYTTMAYEVVTQLKGEKPTHIFLQAGVGSMAGAIAAFFADLYGKDRPIVTIVEPNKANCMYLTAKANDGKLHNYTGEMKSIMAGLCCGEPCSIAWDILNDYADFFVSMDDYVAAKGMRILGNPLEGDKKIVAGESGASTFGLVSEVLSNPSLNWLKEQLKIDENSRILCFSTEGDTDKENYRKIVWDGLHESY